MDNKNSLVDIKQGAHIQKVFKKFTLLGSKIFDRIQMKFNSIIAMFLHGSASGAATFNPAMTLERSARSPSFRGALSSVTKPISHLMRRTVMQDESTFYDIILSGADSLPKVNALLIKRDPHFVKLSQAELDTLVDQWLFQMLAK